MTRNTHDINNDHFDDLLDTRVVIDGSIADYLFGTALHTVLQGVAANSGGFGKRIYESIGSGFAEVKANGSSGWIEMNSTNGVVFPILSADPTTVRNGLAYYNSSTHKLRLYANGSWVDLN